MKMHLKPALILMGVLTLVTGVVYPLAVTGVAQLLFPASANGSVLRRDGKPVGSSRIGQPFDDPRWFWGRLSATAPVPYTAFNAEKGSGSGGSNLGPLNPALRDAAAARVQALRQADPANPRPIPADLVTASGSGLDPDISPAAADYQVERVARARGLDPDRVRGVVAAHTRGPQFGFLGEGRVNVLEVNLALEGLK
jgi:K+-transporting ATPase ATPase C chain